MKLRDLKHRQLEKMAAGRRAEAGQVSGAPTAQVSLPAAAGDDDRPGLGTSYTVVPRAEPARSPWARFADKAMLTAAIAAAGILPLNAVFLIGYAHEKSAGYEGPMSTLVAKIQTTLDGGRSIPP